MTKEHVLGGRYERDREIGRGGMGAVWLGRDTVLRRTVAIKQIGLGPAGGATDVDRAEREARLAARLNHDHVVAVYDLVVEDDAQWMVMEHVDGASLAAMIGEGGALDPQDAEPIVRQIASALTAAHQHGIVHRDVKPSNILVTHDGVAKLSDFGIARAEADASLTRTGLITGSPAYLAPEILTGGAATTASDVWSFGATVFHALAGRPPYVIGSDLLAAMHRVVDEEPPRLEADHRLARLVTAMMQRDPGARPTMDDVTEALSSAPAAAPDPEATQALAPLAPPVMTDPPPQPAPTRAAEPLGPGSRRGDRRGSRAGWFLAAAGAVLLAVVILSLQGRGSPDEEPPAATQQSSAPAPADSAAPSATTAEQLEGFAADYLTAADNDPEAGFAMLTPDYQAASGGLEGYRSFWDRVDDLDVQDLRGDPDALTVSYTYAYELDGDPVTEDVMLQLVRSGDGFLIADAS